MSPEDGPDRRDDRGFAERPFVRDQRTVLIDGMNVALQNVPSYVTDGAAKRAKALTGLAMAVEYFKQRHVTAKVFAPRGFVDGHRPDIDELEREGLLYCTPGGLDDHFLLQTADEDGLFFVSNDRFLDHARDRGYDQRWIDFHRIPFMFNPTFAPEPDAMVRMTQGPTGAYGPGRARPGVPRTAADDLDSLSGSLAAMTTRHRPPVVVAEPPRRPPIAPPPPEIHGSSASFPVARSTVGRIIGRSGANVKRLEEAHRVKIRVADTTDDTSTVTVVCSPPHDDESQARLAACVDDIQNIVAQALGYWRQDLLLQHDIPEDDGLHDPMDTSF